MGKQRTLTMLAPIDIEDLLVWAFREQEVETNPAADGDAQCVQWAVLALPVIYGAMITHFARAGHPPEWHPGPGTLVALEDARRARALYEEWVSTLVVLRRALEGTLAGFRVCGPAAVQQPWQGRRRA